MILQRVTVLELAGLAPSQYCGQILSDFGARVIRVDKIGDRPPYEELLGDGKLSISINLKAPKGIDVLKRMSGNVDVLVEPYRAGVMEKLGIGPEVLLKKNKRLIYARLSGFGQTGLYSKKAGHDINFLSLAGVLSLFGWNNEKPTPPCNVIGDFGGGSLLCAFGIALALYEREKSGLGQVVDLSILRGASYLTSWIHSSRNLLWSQPRGENVLDGGLGCYNVYETKDGKWMAVGSLEEQFYNKLLIGLNLTHEECSQTSAAAFDILTKKFKEKTQAEWIEIFSNLDACVTPVLSIDEAVKERPQDYVINKDDLPVPKPEPRFSRSKTIPSATKSKPKVGQHTVQVLIEAGFSKTEIQQLFESDVIYYPQKTKL